MAAHIFPVDAVAGAPLFAGRALRQLSVSPFVAIATPSRPLGGLSGVRPGTPSNTVTVTSTTWSVATFGGVIDGEAAAIAGVYSYSFDEAQSGAMTPAGGTARVDRLDVQIDDPAEGDATTLPTVRVVYTPGTPALAAAPVRSHPLAQINVPVSGGGSPTVSWVPSYYAAPGAFVPFPNLALLKLWTTAPYGQHATVFGDATPANNGDYTWNGTGWATQGAASTALTPATGWTAGTGVNAPRLVRNGQQVTVYGSLAWAGGGAYATMFTVPAAFRPPTMSAQRQIGVGAQFTGTSLILALMVLNTTGVVGVGVGADGSLPASGAVVLNGLSWWMD